VGKEDAIPYVKEKALKHAVKERLILIHQINTVTPEQHSNTRTTK
jgi:hypothetical protein